MGSVSLCDASSVQVLVSSPSSVQVAALVTVHSLHWWVCPGAPVAEMTRVSLCEGSSLHVLVASPLSVSVGSFVTSHSPQSWVCAAPPGVNVPGAVSVVLLVHVIVPFSAVMLFPDTVTVKVNVAFDGLSVKVPPLETLLTVPVLFFDPAVNS
jgi:hypothetical protein